MDLDKILVQDHRNAEYELGELLRRSPLSALYFGCSLSTPCRQFARKLNAFKRSLDEQKRSFQSILVSCDQSAKELDAYCETLNLDLPDPIKHFRVKFSRPAIEKLFVHFGVLTIPTVIILDSNRVVITLIARAHIEYRGTFVYDDWLRMVNNY